MIACFLCFDLPYESYGVFVKQVLEQTRTGTKKVLTPCGFVPKRVDYDDLQPQREQNQLVVAQVRLWCRLFRLTTD
jgi:hypothetical protein